MKRCPLHLVKARRDRLDHGPSIPSGAGEVILAWEWLSYIAVWQVVGHFIGKDEAGASVHEMRGVSRVGSDQLGPLSLTVAGVLHAHWETRSTLRWHSVMLKLLEVLLKSGGDFLCVKNGKACARNTTHD